jgi:ribosomal protein L24E
MPTCSFCKRSFNAPRGLTVFQFNGKAVHFCSSKCRKNSALKRDPKKVNWIRKNSEMKKSEKQKDNSG